MPADASTSFALASRRVFVAGHRGMVGSAIVRRLASESCEILTAGRSQVDLRRQADVEAWFSANKPDAVVLAAATVGGILANDTRPAEFIYDNLAIQNAVIEASHRTGVRKLLFLGSSCIYPKLAKQPMAEDELLTGPLEETNQWYAIAKIAGIKMCQAYRRQYGSDFVSVMPTNLYGPGDNFDLQGSHVIPALILKAHRAKLAGAASFPVWGSGRPKREFLHVDDLADACVHVLKTYSGESHLNVGTGEDIAIADLAALVARVVGFEGRIELDPTKPDGTPRKLMDVSRLAEAGWKASIPLERGLAEVYGWFLEGLANGTIRGAG
jgi:GDP-L-fucose synthase